MTMLTMTDDGDGGCDTNGHNELASQCEDRFFRRSLRGVGGQKNEIETQIGDSFKHNSASEHTFQEQKGSRVGSSKHILRVAKNTLPGNPHHPWNTNGG